MHSTLSVYAALQSNGVKTSLYPLQFNKAITEGEKRDGKHMKLLPAASDYYRSI